MKRHSFLFAEMVVALLVASLVLTTCVGLFVHLWRTSTYLEQRVAREGERWRRTAYLRWLLSRIQRTSAKDPFVLEDSGRLIFTFDHGLHINPKLANQDVAQLYVDPSLGLVLVTRSHPRWASIREEKEVASVVWPGAVRVEWSFALPSEEAGSLGNSAEGVRQKGGWFTAWKATWPHLPAAIQLKVYEASCAEPVILTALLEGRPGCVTAGAP